MFKIKRVLKCFPGSEPAGAARCSGGGRGGGVRCYLPSDGGRSSRSAARDVAGADRGLEDDAGTRPQGRSAPGVVPGQVLNTLFQSWVTAYVSAPMSTFRWQKQ